MWKLVARVAKKRGIYLKGPSQYDLLSGIDLRPGNVAIDCGANVGNITAIMSSKGATVYAFEPNPHIYQILKRRFSRVSNVHCINKAVLDHNDRLRLFLHEHYYEDKFGWSESSSLLSCKENVSPEMFVEVDTVDLSEFINHLNTDVKIVKIDVEGSECQIINKLIDTGVIKKIEVLLAEVHDKQIPSLKEQTNKLRSRIEKEGLSNICLEWH
jgi:FkbM family methyltransferase